MNTQIDLAGMDFETAYRIAKARGMAERARVVREIAAGAAAAVRGLFARPERECAEC